MQAKTKVQFPRIDDLVAAVQSDECVGYCIACGNEQWGVEPDARKYRCEACGEHKVYGAEELLIMVAG